MANKGNYVTIGSPVKLDMGDSLLDTGKNLRAQQIAEDELKAKQLERASDIAYRNAQVIENRRRYKEGKDLAAAKIVKEENKRKGLSKSILSYDREKANQDAFMQDSDLIIAHNNKMKKGREGIARKHYLDWALKQQEEYGINMGGPEARGLTAESVENSYANYEAYKKIDPNHPIVQKIDKEVAAFNNRADTLSRNRAPVYQRDLEQLEFQRLTAANPEVNPKELMLIAKQNSSWGKNETELSKLALRHQKAKQAQSNKEADLAYKFWNVKGRKASFKPLNDLSNDAAMEKIDELGLSGIMNKIGLGFDTDNAKTVFRDGRKRGISQGALLLALGNNIDRNIIGDSLTDTIGNIVDHAEKLDYARTGGDAASLVEEFRPKDIPYVDPRTANAEAYLKELDTMMPSTRNVPKAAAYKELLAAQNKDPSSSKPVPVIGEKTILDNNSTVATVSGKDAGKVTVIPNSQTLHNEENTLVKKLNALDKAILGSKDGSVLEGLGITSPSIKENSLFIRDKDSEGNILTWQQQVDQMNRMAITNPITAEQLEKGKNNTAFRKHIINNFNSLRAGTILGRLDRKGMSDEHNNAWGKLISTGVEWVEDKTRNPSTSTLEKRKILRNTLDRGTDNVLNTRKGLLSLINKNKEIDLNYADKVFTEQTIDDAKDYAIAGVTAAPIVKAPTIIKGAITHAPKAVKSVVSATKNLFNKKGVVKNIDKVTKPINKNVSNARAKYDKGYTKKELDALAKFDQQIKNVSNVGKNLAKTPDKTLNQLISNIQKNGNSTLKDIIKGKSPRDRLSAIKNALRNKNPEVIKELNRMTRPVKSPIKGQRLPSSNSFPNQNQLSSKGRILMERLERIRKADELLKNFIR